MAEDGPYGLVVSFSCPVCGDEIRMETTHQHNLHQLSTPHQPSFSQAENLAKDRCAVSFNRVEKAIRDQYDFIEYEVPLVFTHVGAWVTDEEVLDAAIEGLKEQHLGVTVEVALNNSPFGYVYAWYHGNRGAYYAVTHRLGTPQNVTVTGSEEDLREVLERWFYFDPEESP